jgi:hypothetical protein
MKKLMMIGAVAGMAVVTACGWQQRRDPADILLESCLAAIGGAALMRWWGRTLIRNWHQSAAQPRRGISPIAQPTTSSPRRS